MLRLRRSLSTASARLSVITADAALARWREKIPTRAANDLLACYSSDLSAIITDPSLMLIPMDDHGFHRGHAVFDTCNVERGRAFGLTMHLDRLLNSATAARVLAASDATPSLREELRRVSRSTHAG